MSRQLPLQAEGGGRAVDRALAEVLRRLDPATEPAVLKGAELASLAVALGHAALDLQRPQLLVESFDALPQPRPWREALQRSRWVATPLAHEASPGDAPMVLEGDLLYLRRYREYERRLAAGLLRKGSAIGFISSAAGRTMIRSTAGSGWKPLLAAHQSSRRSKMRCCGVDRTSFHGPVVTG